MNDKINRILETDKQARAHIEEVKAAAAESRNALVSDAAKFRKEYSEKSQNEIEAVRKKEKAKIDSERNELKKVNKQICEKLEKHYKENADKWIDEIVKNVTTH